MSNQFQFTTVCCGGPLDGLQFTKETGETAFKYLRAGGCEVMEGDCLVTANATVVEDCYYLMTFMLAWPSGYLWRYTTWIHESLLPVDQENINHVMGSIHPSDCHVDRHYVKELDQPPTTLFRYGHVVLSRN